MLDRRQIQFFSHVQFLLFAYYASTRSSDQLLPVVVRLPSANQNTKHSYQALLSTPTYPAVVLLFVMSNLTLNTLKPKANIVKYSRETNCMYLKRSIMVVWGYCYTVGFQKPNQTITKQQKVLFLMLPRIHCFPSAGAGSRNASWYIGAPS